MYLPCSIYNIYCLKRWGAYCNRMQPRALEYAYQPNKKNETIKTGQPNANEISKDKTKTTTKTDILL